MLERSAKSDDSDARWIVRENLGKNRLQRLDPQRVADLLGVLGNRARG
jgi:hypothetical protein